MGAVVRVVSGGIDAGKRSKDRVTAKRDNAGKPPRVDASFSHTTKWFAGRVKDANKTCEVATGILALPPAPMRLYLTVKTDRASNVESNTGQSHFRRVVT